ncbi:MAG: hypothetical protein ABL997_17390, partial [Planctomycetota bacterium]
MNEFDDHYDRREAWADRALDAALHELHGSKPPDLSARVVEALREAPRGALPVLSPPQRRVVRSQRQALAASLLVLIALVTTWFMASAFFGRDGAPDVDRLSAVLELAVVRGTFELTEMVEVSGNAATLNTAAHSTVVAFGEQGSFTARAGNRLRSASSSLARLGPFGAIEVGPGTELEVRSMELTWKQGVVVASA